MATKLTRTFRYYQARNNQWYWRLQSGNGRVIADGSEGYLTERNVLRAIEKLQDTLSAMSVAKVTRMKAPVRKESQVVDKAPAKLGMLLGSL